MSQTYELDLCGRKETLPVLKLPSGIKIAFFNLHGNRVLTEFCAQKLYERLKGFDFDVLLTAESKGLQLAHCLCALFKQDFYAVARKSLKLYMQDGICAEVNSITTASVQKLYLSQHDADLIKNKRVAIVDDVVSTGSSFSGLEILVEKAGGRTVLKAAVLAEGEAALREDVVYLGKLPIL